MTSSSWWRVRYLFVASCSDSGHTETFALLSLAEAVSEAIVGVEEIEAALEEEGWGVLTSVTACPFALGLPFGTI
jgi:hypothetical protein